MYQNDYKIYKEFANKIHAKFPGAKIWLFGSRARGDNHSESDFDILIVVPKLNKFNKRTISDIAWEVSFEKNLLIAPIIYSFDKFIYPAIQKSPFISNIIQKGIPG